MYNEDTELIFPPRLIPQLRDERGQPWQELVDRVKDLDEMHPDHLAFMLMMTKLNGCNSCHSDSFRAMRGCTQCTLQNVHRFKGGDAALVKRFDKARKDLEKKFGK